MAGVLRNYRRFRFFIHTHDVCNLQIFFLIFLQVSIPAVSQLKPPAGLVSGQNYTKELWKPTGEQDSVPRLNKNGVWGTRRRQSRLRVPQDFFISPALGRGPGGGESRAFILCLSPGFCATAFARCESHGDRSHRCVRKRERWCGSDSGRSLSTLSQSGAERSPGVCRKKIEAVAG
jgi:hypothetical protein